MCSPNAPKGTIEPKRTLTDVSAQSIDSLLTATLQATGNLAHISLAVLRGGCVTLVGIVKGMNEGPCATCEPIAWRIGVIAVSVTYRYAGNP